LRGFVRHVILTAETRAAGDEEMTDEGSERLGDQLQRVIATGLSKPEAERAICAGISAGEIVIYRWIEKIDPNGHTLFTNRNRFWSSHLKYSFPEDFDWEKSLFSGRLQKLNHLSPPFQLKWIELSNEGIRHLCFEISLRQMGLQEAGAVNQVGKLVRVTSADTPPNTDRQEAPHGFTPAARNGDAPPQHALDPLGDVGPSIAQGDLHDAPQSSRRTAAAESVATRALASQLRDNPDLKRADAKNWCATAGYQLSARGFQSRVWPEARTLAGLPAIGSPGRKRKKTQTLEKDRSDRSPSRENVTRKTLR